MGEPVKDPFVTESITVKIHDQELVLSPLPFKKFREAISLARGAFALAQTAAEQNPMGIIEDVPTIIMAEFCKIAPIIFSRPDLPPEWFDEHVSVPLAQHCLTEAAKVNGVGDFLSYLRKAGTPTAKPEAQTK
jgi:hypothetical protein